MSNPSSVRYPIQDPVANGIKGNCPRCGEGDLLSGLSVKQSCSACGLDFEFSDSGDGPTVFIILNISVIVLGAALFVEISYEPSIWVHTFAWPPLICLLGIPALRVVKGILICQQYNTGASQGKLDEGEGV